MTFHKTHTWCRKNTQELGTTYTNLHRKLTHSVALQSHLRTPQPQTMLLSSARSVGRAFAPALFRPGGASLLRGMAQTPDSDTHDDFAPQVKSNPAASVTEQIQQDIKDNKVFVYMKGNPEAPMCGFSNMVCKILDAYGVEYSSRNVLTDPDLREGVKKLSEWPTIPQVYIDGEFVGGSDILMGMHESGDLAKAFKK